MTNLISEYLPVTEALKVQFQFSATENNTSNLVSILPSRNTQLRQTLQTRFPDAFILSKLDIISLELRVKINSIDEWEPPLAIIKGTDSEVEQNRELIKSWWNAERKQIEVLHQLNSQAPQYPRASLVLLNKGDAESYYLEDFLSVFTLNVSYPLSEGENCFLRLFDSGYGLLEGTDTILFTGVYQHYLSVIE